MRSEPEHGVLVELEPGSEGAAHTVAVAVRFPDDRIERSRLRTDLVAPGLKVGDAVIVTRAALYRRWRIDPAPETNG